MGQQPRLQHYWRKKALTTSTFVSRFSQVDVQVFAISSSLIIVN
jgi:hypothetical protein